MKSTKKLFLELANLAELYPELPALDIWNYHKAMRGEDQFHVQDTVAYRLLATVPIDVPAGEAIYKHLTCIGFDSANAESFVTNGMALCFSDGEYRSTKKEVESWNLALVEEGKKEVAKDKDEVPRFLCRIGIPRNPLFHKNFSFALFQLLIAAKESVSKESADAFIEGNTKFYLPYDIAKKLVSLAERYGFKIIFEI